LNIWVTKIVRFLRFFGGFIGEGGEVGGVTSPRRVWVYNSTQVCIVFYRFYKLFINRDLHIPNLKNVLSNRLKFGQKTRFL